MAPGPATRRRCRGVRFFLPEPSILLRSARRRRSSPSQKRVLQRRGKCWAPRASQACGFPSFPLRSSHLRPGNPTAWGRPSVNGPLGTQGTEGKGRTGSLWAGRVTEGVGGRAARKPPRAPSRQRWGAAQPALRPPPPPPDQSRRLGTQPTAAYEPEETDVWRGGRGEAPPPITAEPRLETIKTASPRRPAERTCAGALPLLPAPAFRLRFLRRLLVTCQAPTKENRAQGPGSQAFSLAWEQRAICSGSRSSSSGTKYNDSSGVLSFPGRRAAQTARSGTGSSQ